MLLPFMFIIFFVCSSSSLASVVVCELLCLRVCGILQAATRPQDVASDRGRKIEKEHRSSIDCDG